MTLLPMEETSPFQDNNEKNENKYSNGYHRNLVLFKPRIRENVSGRLAKNSGIFE